MIISDQGVALLSEREGGYRTEAYQDTQGNWTVGLAHTGPEVSAGIVWTLEKCKDVFQKDLSRFEGAINFRVMPTLTQYQFDALVSFAFNVGVGAFESSTMLKLINQGDMAAAAAEFDRWHIPPEITSRRNGEKAQFMGTAFEARIP